MMFKRKRRKIQKMGKLFVLMGKSASGKDAAYKRLLQDAELGLKPYVGYTTRPVRENEQDGREYFFVTPDELERLERSGKVIEKRTYHSVHGDWHYFSVDDGKVDLDSSNYLYIGTPEAYVPLRDHYGASRVIPIYMQVEDGERLSRALARERKETTPRYAEMCRRFLGDTKDFSDEKLEQAGIEKRFDNIDFEECISQIKEYIRSLS